MCGCVCAIQDVDEYYHDASPSKTAHRITVPTLAMSAEDDPLCNIQGLDSIESLGDGLVIVRTSIGGHLAWLEGWLGGASSLMERVALGWIEACLAARTT